MKIVLYPLMGILHLGAETYSLFGFSPDLGIFFFCLVVSSLMSIVYLAPWAFLISFLKKKVVSARKIRTISFIWAISLLMILISELARFPLLMMASGGIFVLTTSCLATLVITRALMKRCVRTT